jgi:hypothetical protein
MEITMENVRKLVRDFGPVGIVDSAGKVQPLNIIVIHTQDVARNKSFCWSHTALPLTTNIDGSVAEVYFREDV